MSATPPSTPDPATRARRLDHYNRVEEELATKIGSRLRAARTEAGLSQGELGDALGYAGTMVSAFEKGRRRLKLEDLARVCIVLGKSPDYFLRTGTLQPRESRSVAATLRAQFAVLPHDTLREFINELLDEVEAAPPVSSTVPVLRHLQADAAARALLDHCGILEPPVQVADDVCELLGIPIYWRDVPDALSGLLLQLDDENFVIAVNERHTEPRRRFSVAHELGHAVLAHSAIYHLDWDEHAGNDPHYRYLDERAANAFAASLLMDERWVRKDFSGGIRGIRQLAARYQVSEAAMGFRLVNLGLA